MRASKYLISSFRQFNSINETQQREPKTNVISEYTYFEFPDSKTKYYIFIEPNSDKIEILYPAVTTLSNPDDFYLDNPNIAGLEGGRLINYIKKYLKEYGIELSEPPKGNTIL